MEKIRNGQSLLDMAIQEYGNADMALEIAIANGISLTDDLTAGDEPDAPAETEDSPETKAYYRERNLHPATAITKEDIGNIPYGGIEYMGIEIDFIVS